ncbi:amidohydrolase family protein [Pseudoalteromonas spongiae]|uniref:amidohydrolase family protein n=1 Tax=Pseudoalteromonas spongiae TaxID=298657 RepID=UPI001485FA2D|nr:amidohydrolase family protein [Pseudoalteromonas spongiae]
MDTQRNNAIFDPHLHLFDLDEGDYFWLKNALPPWPKISLIQRNFTPADLKLPVHFQLDGYAHIEAGFNNDHPAAEIAFLEQKYKRAHCAISYAQIDQDPHTFKEQIQDFSRYATFVGIRDISEGADAERLLKPEVVSNFALLESHQLIFEAQFELHQHPITKRLCDLAKACPTLNIVLNHAGLVTAESFDDWHTAIKKLARFDNIAIKYSGFEMIDLPLNEPFRKTVLTTLVTHFGENRVMFASNFPICLMTSSYASLWQQYYDLCPNTALWQKLSFANAKRIYQIQK